MPEQLDENLLRPSEENNNDIETDSGQAIAWEERELIAQVGQSKNRKTEAPQAKQTSDTRRESFRKEASELQKLTGKHDIAGLTKFALVAENRELAIDALLPIVKDKSIPILNKIAIFRQLARSDSKVSGIGIHLLSGASPEVKDQEVVLELINNGQINQLWNSEKITANDLACLLALGKQPAAARIMQALDAHPNIKHQVVQELLNRSLLIHPYSLSGASGDTWTITADASDSLKLDSIKYLIDKKPPGYDTALAEIASFASKRELRAPAIAELMPLWTGEKQKPTGEQSISEFLMGDRVLRLVNGLKAIRWNDGQNNNNTPAIYNEWLKTEKEANEQIIPKRETLKKAADLRKTLDAIAIKREDILNKNVSEILERAGLKMSGFKFKLTLDEDLHGQGSTTEKVIATHDGSTGEIKIGESFVMSNNDLPSYLSGLIIHELVHHEQQSLVIKALVDELERNKQIKIDDTVSADIKNNIKELYAARTVRSSGLADGLLNGVLRSRSQKLTTGEQKRAEALMGSDKTKADSALEFSARSKELNVLNRFIGLLDQEPRAEVSLPESLFLADVPRLLGVDQLPADIAHDYKILEDAQKKGASNFKDLNLALRKTLKDEFIFRKKTLENLNNSFFKSGLHEQEAYSVGRRAFFFAEIH